MQEKIKLNIGCGKDIRIGWENLAGDKDIREMSYKEETVDAILLNHMVMYLRPEEMDKIAEKMFKWLKIGGTVHIETQDFDKITDQETMFGMGEHAGHRWAWKPQELRSILEKAGFEVSVMPGILHGKPERDFLVSGIKTL